MISRKNAARLAAAFAVVSVLGIASRSAHAAQYLVDFNVNPGTSLALKIAPPIFSAQTKNITLSGSMSSLLDTGASTFQINDATINASNTSFNFSIIFLASLNVALSNLQMGWTSPALPYAGTSIDLGGSQLSIDQGTLVATGTGLASSVNENINFSTDPIDFAVPSPTLATLNVVNPVTPNITLSVPINVNEIIPTDAGDVTVTLTGTINLTAVSSTLVVPEPSTIFLACTAGLGLCMASRRRFRRA
jgi:hypothetical protein